MILQRKSSLKNVSGGNVTGYPSLIPSDLLMFCTFILSFITSISYLEMDNLQNER